jgi:DNA polymerase III subunit epsilon
MRFAAIDFETADNGSDSACALGIVVAEDGAIVRRGYWLIRPPRRDIRFTWVHGIAWEHVADKPCFAELWPEIAEMLHGAQFLAAHNASFDRNVLRGCCSAATLALPAHRFLCTVQAARRVWDIYPTKLPNVCSRLGIPLKHHDAASDAEACATIALKALERAPGLVDRLVS